VALTALVAAHAQSAWNRSTRQLTRAGRNVALAFIGFVWLFGAASLGVGMGSLGWAAGHDLKGAGLNVASVTLFGLSWGLGFVFGLTGGGRLLEVGQLKAYPVRPLTLVFAELAARLAEPITAGAAFGLGSLHVGLFIAAPQLLPRLLVLFPISLYTLVALQFVLGELLTAIARRARIALALVVVASMGFSPRFLAWLNSGDTSRFARLQRLADFIQRLPITALLKAPTAELAVPLLLTLVPLVVLTLAGMYVMSREQSAHAQVATEREGGLWSFETASAGIARLHMSTLFRTPVGRYSLIAPLFAMVMVPWVMQLLFGVQRASLAVFMYAALGTVQFHFNMFGFDGPAVGELFRLPIPSRALIAGKHLAVLAFALLEGAVLALFLRFVREESIPECIAGLCVFMAVNLLMASLGRFVSVVWPRTLPRSGMRGSAPPLPVVLVNLFGTLGIAGSLGITHWLVQRHAPGLVIPWGVLVVAVAAAVFAVTLAPAARFLEARREHVLLAMK
jgi:hypothetical protein